MSSYIEYTKNIHYNESDWHCPETNRIKGEQILPFLLDMSPSDIKKGVKPSQVFGALQLSTEERLEQSRSPSRKYKIGSKNDAFSRTPEAIIFQNFKAGVSYRATLVVTNQRTIVQNLNVYFETSRFFTFLMDNEECKLTRIAPGRSNVFHIIFLPTDSSKDYIHEVRFECGNSNFTVPIFALGPRPIVYVPDKIILPPTLVKVESSQTIVLKNKGDLQLNYANIVSEPFACNTLKGIVPPNEIVEIKYSCYSTKAGHIVGKSDINIRNDITITIELECQIENVKVELDSRIISFDDLYLGLCSRKTLLLRNNSEFPLNFAWKLNDHEKENQTITKLIDLMQEMKEYEQKRCEKLKYFDIIDEESHRNVYERIFEDEKREFLKNEKFLYKSNFFEIIPKVGKILPRSIFEFCIIFAPSQNISCYSAAYLDIEGTERRVRVSMQGYGLGPPVILMVKDLNVGQIYLTDKHQYELPVMNKGVIPVTVTYQPKKTDWGGVIACNPESMTIKASSTLAVLIVFYSDQQGEFIETLDFKVEESGEHLQCIFSGNVICPFLKCVPEKLDFGTVSVGINNERIIGLVNESRVNIKYDFYFENEFETNAKQYIQIIPASGIAQASSEAKVQVIFCCDHTSQWKTNLLLVMWNTRRCTTKIPLTCKCACPLVTCHPEIVSIKFCFLNTDYKRKVKLTNKTDLPGSMVYIPNEDSSDSAIECIPNTTEVSFKAHETIELELRIKVSSLGSHSLPVQFSVIGGETLTLCTISCNGQGPVVSYSPDEVNFGVINVLERSEKKLTLTNDSPISAQINVYCIRKSSFYIKESDRKLELKPEEQTNVTIWALFNDPGTYKDTICVDIYQGDQCTIKVSGEGAGTSILCEPQLSPSLNLGTILTYKQFAKEIKITNKGNARHKLLFTQRRAVRNLKETDDDSIPCVFNISPHYLEIEPDHMSSITIKCTSTKPKVVTEEFYCHALVGKSSQVQTIICFILEAQFVDPNVDFSKRNVHFKLDVIGDVAEGNLQDKITIDNNTGVPIQVRLSMDDNAASVFSFSEEGLKTVRFNGGIKQTSSLSIKFSPPIKEKRKFCRTARLIFEYENHPKTDIIQLQGDIMFPTVELSSSLINFNCVPLGSTAQKNVIIQNVSAMMVYFQWYWSETSIAIKELDPIKETASTIILKNKIDEQSIFMEYIPTKSIDTDDMCAMAQKSILFPDHTVSSPGLATLMYDKSKYLEEMKCVLSSILLPYNVETREGQRLSPNAASQSNNKRITKMFSLEPSEGVLKPNEYSIITIACNPPPNTNITATAICKIKGGEEEQLVVKGKSAKLSYLLDKNYVNFGNQIFCEMCSGQLTLINNGVCSIDFKVTVEEAMSMQAEMLDVNPKRGNLPAGEHVNFNVDYFPGFPGHFDKSFMLELGYLDPNYVTVCGYAVLSQIYLHAPRNDMQLNVEDYYKALAWITEEYLDSVQNTDNAEVVDEIVDSSGFLEENNWVYVSYKDLYPTLMDIDMSLERISLLNFLNKNPKILKDHNVTKKVPNIPYFSPAPYCVDFGFVVRDMPLCYTILLYNYGPTNADVKLLEDNKTALLEKEIKIEFKTRILAPGETNELHVIFAPSKKKYPDLNKALDEVFRLVVRHGPIVSVQVKGVVTLPVVSLDYDALYFNKVYRGDVLRKTILLSNNGNVSSKWFATISKPTKKGEAVGFFIIPKTGELDPGKKTSLDIYFLPVGRGKIKRTLRINIESNNEAMLMNLYGEGIEATFMVVPNELNFSPILSYFENTLHFAIQNMTEKPIEFYFPSMDSDTKYDKMLIQLYLEYKNLKYVFIPSMAPGAALPDFFAETYNNLVEKLRRKMLAISAEDDEIGTEVDVDQAEAKPISDEIDTKDPLSKYSLAELNNLLKDYIVAEGFESDCVIDNATTYNMDDTSERIEIVEPLKAEVLTEVERKAALFIFHGAPTTEYYRAANQVGIALSAPVYSIDRLIIESLIEDPPRVESGIISSINNAFVPLLDPTTDAELLERLKREECAYDQILDKINIILTTKPRKDSKKGSPQDKGSKLSSEKSYGTKGKQGSSDTFLNISLETIAELLRHKLKAFSVLVIESLKSIFLPQENLALHTVLKAAGFIQYINLVILSFTVADYVKNEVKLQKHLDVANTGKSETPVKTEPTSNEKQTKTSTKAGSEKVSKSSHAASSDVSKKILQNLNKAFKAELEAFESLQQEIWHVARNWDKKTLLLKKPYISPNKKDASSKDSARTVKKNSSSYLDEPSSEPDIYLWLLLNASNNRSVDFPKTIRNCIETDPQLQIVLHEIAEAQKEKFEESEVTFSVISKPSTGKNDESSVFIIKNFLAKEPMSSLKQVDSKISFKGKRKRSSKLSRSSELKIGMDVSAPYVKADCDNEFSSKMVLAPGDLIKYQVTFCPRKCGLYNYRCMLELTKENTPYQIKFQALCEYPAIDVTPEVMFPKTLENYKEKASYDHFVFIKDQKIFDFGSILVGSSLEKCLVYATSIDLRNISSSNCDVAVSLSNDLFCIEPTNLIIAPHEADKLKISVKSIKTGTLTSQLYISIKNNPCVEDFTLACSPCKLEFSIQPKTISFDKVPLRYSTERVIKLTNTSPINIRWEFVEPNWALGVFNLSQESGYIRLYSVCELHVRFHPTEEIIFPKRHVSIKVFDVNSSSIEPCFMDNITIYADSVEYNLAIDNQIDFGEIKGGIEHKRTFVITNKGKSEVILKIEAINNPLQAYNFVRDYIKVQPSLLVIGAQKTENASVVFWPKRSFCISNLLIFVVSMVESMQSGHVVKSYNVTMSATTFMPIYKVCPQSVVNFGHVQILTTKRMTIELTNKGRFSFGFVMNDVQVTEVFKKDSPGKHDTRTKATAKNDNMEKSSKIKSKEGSKVSKETPKKEDKAKIKATNLHLNGFNLTQSSGIVSPNETFLIEVEYTPKELKTYQETIMIKITEIEDVHKNKTITLKGIGCEPKMNFSDFESIFTEQFIVSRIEDFVPPKNVNGCSVFCTSNTSLYFKLACMNTSISTRLNFKNVGHTASILIAQLNDNGKHVFSVTPANCILEPHMTDSIEISFKPQTLQEVTGILELSYNASVNNKLTIDLYGQACLPQIALLEPSSALSFGPICVGFTGKERLTFKNIGQIKCKVLVEMSTSNEALIIVPIGTTFNALNVQDEDCLENMKHHLMVNLLLDEIAEFDIVYKPLKQESIQALLTLHIIQNPYEIHKIAINAISFDNGVILEGLEPFQLSALQLTSAPLVSKNPFAYMLNLGYKQLNMLYKKSFFIRNRSNNDIYKFRFYNHPAITFTPEVGHLTPGTVKEVLAIFKAVTPILLTMVELTCTISKIQYTSPNENALSWDSRQKFAYCTSELLISTSSVESFFRSVSRDSSNLMIKTDDGNVQSKAKAVTEGTEPEIVTIPDSFETVALYLTVSADYCRYHCETTVIDFADTYIKEESIQTFEVQNIGNIPIKIVWSLFTRSNSFDPKKSSSETRITQTTVHPDDSLKSASTTSLTSSTEYIQTEAYLPLKINPKKIVINPEETITFSVTFYPQEENNFEAILKSNIESLDPHLNDICIDIFATALPIPFYFEMEDGSSSSKDINLEFEIVGLTAESMRKLLLVNPSNENISFDIVSKERNEFSYFFCDNLKGIIHKKKKFIVTFCFRPPIFGSFKDSYELRIIAKDIQRTITLRGICREPKVYFTEMNICLKPTVPRVKNIKSLILRNDESFPVAFKFSKKSLHSECQQEKLDVFPILGKLRPQSESDIKISFTTLNVVSTKFHLKCLIEKLKSPLSVHVSVESIKMQPAVSFTTRNGEVISLIEDKVNILDLGCLCKCQRYVTKFKISNNGQKGMFYTWEFDSKQVAHFIKMSVENEKEFLKSGQTVITDLIFYTVRAGMLKEFKINLNIKYGPKYTIHVSAMINKLFYSFSFDFYNFGHCLTQVGKTSHYSTILRFKNMDSKSILLQNTFENTDHLTVDFSSNTVLPGEAENILIKFHPQNVGLYKSDILFLLGGNKYVIAITGEGVKIKLELLNFKDRFIYFGNVLMETVNKHRIGVYNDSQAKISVHFDIFDNLMVHKNKIEKIENTMKMPVIAAPSPKEVKIKKNDKMKDESKEYKVKADKTKVNTKGTKAKNEIETKQAENSLTISQLLLTKQAEERSALLKCLTIVPNMFIDIPPRGKAYFDIAFRPDTKCDIEEKIYFEIQDYFESICVVKGSSVIPEFSLDTKEILFTGVVIGCTSAKFITLRNTGDIIGSFIWKLEDNRNLFTIEPKRGFVLPKSDVKIKIAFASKYEKCEFKVKAKCLIKETKEPLNLVIKGNSVKIPEPTATIVLKCEVRNQVVDKSVTITNNTWEEWLIQSEISQVLPEVFNSPKEIILKPLSSGVVYVNYFPLSMCRSKPDEGKLLVKLADGSALVYDLIGQTEPPTVKARIEREIRCKQNFYEIIPIRNWLTCNQTFQVTTKMMSPVTIKTLYKIFGLNSVELNGSELLNYKWGVYVVNEGPIEFQVTFKNPQTGEYEYFEINLKVLPSEPVETIVFKTRVRVPITKHISLENPVDIPVTYMIESDERGLTFPKLVNSEPYTMSKIDVTYNPLQIETISSTLTAKCEELGTYTYLIKMQAEGPEIEDCIIVTSELGAFATKTILFKNIYDRSVEFSYKFDNEQFSMERCTSIPSGESSKIVIVFEPSMLGHLNSKLHLTSLVAGEYVYLLDGECIPPTPKGPFTVKLNGSTIIDFKNPFLEDKEFLFQLCPDTFCCNFNENPIKSKKIARFMISVNAEAELRSPITGKLIIYPTDIPNLYWKYYLRFSGSH